MYIDEKMSLKEIAIFYGRNGTGGFTDITNKMKKYGIQLRPPWHRIATDKNSHSKGE